jgi:hypothetical protein
MPLVQSFRRRFWTSSRAGSAPALATNDGW